jgi:hypothetical protein
MFSATEPEFTLQRLRPGRDAGMVGPVNELEDQAKHDLPGVIGYALHKRPAVQPLGEGLLPRVARRWCRILRLGLNDVLNDVLRSDRRRRLQIKRGRNLSFQSLLTIVYSLSPEQKCRRCSSDVFPRITNSLEAPRHVRRPRYPEPLHKLRCRKRRRWNR